MIAILTCWFILFSWISFIGFGVRVITYLDERNHWMPPIYIIWGIILFIVSFILKNFLMAFMN